MSFLCSLAGRSSSRIRVWMPWLNAITRYGAYNMEKITWILEVNPRLKNITAIAIVASQTSIWINMIDTESPSQGSFQSRCKSSSQTIQAQLTCIQASSIPNAPRENNKETTGSKGPGVFYLENPFKSAIVKSTKIPHTSHSVCVCVLPVRPLLPSCQFTIPDLVFQLVLGAPTNSTFPRDNNSCAGLIGSKPLLGGVSRSN